MQTTNTQFAYEIRREYQDIANTLLCYNSTTLDTVGLQALVNVTNRVSMLMEMWDCIERICK